MRTEVGVALGPVDTVTLVVLPARAGGGSRSNPGRSGSFSRSSGSSGSGYSGSSGYRSSPGIGTTSGASAGGGFFGLICLLFIVVVVVVLVVQFRKRGGVLGAAHLSADGPPPGSDGPPAPPPPPLERSAETEAALAAIRERDPAFDEDNFLSGVAISFQLVQKAWCEQVPSESRKVMADGIWVTHKQKIEEMAGRGVKNILEDLHIGRSEIVAANTDPDSESIVVRIHAYSRDYEVDPGNKIVAGDRELRLWTEDWSFVRSATAVTKQGSGSRQTCPNCGAPLNLDNAGVCSYCREMVMGGKHDWVLSRIEQVYS